MIETIHSYKLDKKKNCYDLTSELVKYIENLSKNCKKTNYLIKKISSNFDIPTAILRQKFNQIIFRNFDFKFNKFKSVNLNKIIIDFFKFYSLVMVAIFGHILLRLYKVKKKNFDLLCNKIFSQLEIDRYTNLVKNFESSCLLGNFASKKKIKNEFYFKFNKFLIGNSSIPLSKKFYLLILGSKIFYKSITSKTNLFPIFINLIYDVLKSNYIFTHINAKYYLNNRFYDTSPIFNYYFKNNGGLITSCTQKNICAIPLSCFVFSDVMFTLGKDQGEICNKLGGEIKILKPVGSLFMEDQWFRKEHDLKRVPNSDILIIGINTFFNNRHHVNYVFDKNYYDIFLNWLLKLSNDYPDKKIILKHHVDYAKDPKEFEILNKISNIKVVVDHDSENGTYAYAFKSKIILSFASTMIVEMLGHERKAYFLDPNLEGDQWFRDVKYLDFFRIKNYKDLKSKIEETHNEISIDKKDYYCLESSESSKKISDFLKKYEQVI